MSKVSKQCSILNYLRHEDAELFELIQDLCLGKIFLPRRGSPGITFLRPDKKLLKDIQSMAAGENPEEAIDAIQSLVLLDHVSSLQEFDDKKHNLPTYHQKKLAIQSADSKKVVLKNGAEITTDKNFSARSDRGNIAVYHISGALVDKDGEDADMSAVKPKAKKGGHEISGLSRAQLFEAVLDAYCHHYAKSDAAMELLVSLHGWADVHAKNKPLADLIKSQCSYDTVGSLAIVLQPYKSSNHYISEEEFAAYKTFVGADKVLSAAQHIFTYNPDPAGYYDSLANSGDFADVHKSVKSSAASLARRIGKLNAVNKLNDFYSSAVPAGLPSKRSVPKSQLFAEAELRVISALIFENCGTDVEKDELLSLYRNCNLDKPYMCADKDQMSGSSLGFYYSTVYLIARSDALLYVPNTDGEKTSAVVDDNAFISLNKTFSEMQCLKERRAGSKRDAPAAAAGV